MLKILTSRCIFKLLSASSLAKKQMEVYWYALPNILPSDQGQAAINFEHDICPHFNVRDQTGIYIAWLALARVAKKAKNIVGLLFQCLKRIFTCLLYQLFKTEYTN